MVVGRKEADYATDKYWGDSSIPMVAEATYLGGTLDSNLRRDTHAQSLLAKAHIKVNMLTKFFSNRRIHARLRQMVIDTIVKPTLEWGTAVWAPTTATAKRMQALYSQVQRKIVGVHSHTSGHIVALELGSRSLESWHLQHMLSYCKHLHDMDSTRLTKIAAHAVLPHVPQGPKPMLWTAMQKKMLTELQITTDFFVAEPPHQH